MKMYNMTRPANEFMLVLPTVPTRSAEYLDANYELERADEGPLKQAYVVRRGLRRFTERLQLYVLVNKERLLTWFFHLRFLGWKHHTV